MKNNIMTIVKSLFNQSYRESIKNLQNQVKVILDVTPNISDKFEYVDFKLIKQIQSDFKNLEKIMELYFQLVDVEYDNMDCKDLLKKINNKIQKLINSKNPLLKHN